MAVFVTNDSASAESAFAELPLCLADAPATYCFDSWEIEIIRRVGGVFV